MCLFVNVCMPFYGSLASVSLFYAEDIIYYVLGANNNISERVTDRCFVKRVCVCTAVIWGLSFNGLVMLV